MRRDQLQPLQRLCEALVSECLVTQARLAMGKFKPAADEAYLDYQTRPKEGICPDALATQKNR